MVAKNLRFVRLGWYNNEYFIWDKKNGIAYGFIVDPSDELVERVAKAYDEGAEIFSEKIAKHEPVDYHYYEDLPEDMQRKIEEAEN